MKRKARTFVPEATAFESRLMLSVTASTARDYAEVSELSARQETTARAAVTSTIEGNYFAAEDGRPADAPLHVRLDGMGRVRRIGRAKLSGSLDLGGFRVPDVSGTLALTNARGTVTLQLTGSGGFADVPNGRFVASVSHVKGTGAFAGIRRHGTITFLFGENVIRAIKAPSPIGGAMTVTLRLKPPIR